MRGGTMGEPPPVPTQEAIRLLQPPHRRPVARYPVRLAALTLSAGLATVLSGCGQPAPSDSDDGVDATVSVALQPTLRPDTPTPDSVDPSAPSSGGLFDASQALVSESCTATGDAWSFTGRLENTDTAEHAFTVGVFVTATADGSDVGGKEIVVTVPAGGSAPVAAKNFYTGRTTDVECLTGVTVKADD